MLTMGKCVISAKLVWLAIRESCYISPYLCGRLNTPRVYPLLPISPYLYRLPLDVIIVVQSDWQVFCILIGWLVEKQGAVWHSDWPGLCCSNWMTEKPVLGERGGDMGGVQHCADACSHTMSVCETVSKGVFAHGVSQKPKQSSVLGSRPAVAERGGRWPERDREDWNYRLNRREAKQLQHSLSSFFTRRPESDYGYPQVNPKWDQFSQRYFRILIMILRIKDLGLCVMWDWYETNKADSKEWGLHIIALLCFYRKTDREGCPTQALFEKEAWKCPPSSDTFNSASTIQI